MKIMARVLAGLLVIVASLVALIGPANVVAALQSTNYKFDETSLGGIGNINAQSTNFQSQQTSGILGLSNSTSTNFQINNGHETTGDPALAFAVDSPTINFSNFSATVAATTTSTFEVSDYTSYGYVVQSLGSSPTNGTHTITAMATAGPSQVGIEQFGMNLVANTSPTSFGANPDHGQFGFGSAATNYDTSNNYRFVSGDIIASAPKSSGLTIYTISYIVNVSSITPGGQYSASQTLLCTATF